MNEVKQFLIRYTSGLVRIEHAMLDSVKHFCNQHFGVEDPSEFGVSVTMHDHDEDLSHHLTGQIVETDIKSVVPQQQSGATPPFAPSPTIAPTTAPQTAPADPAAAPQTDAQAANGTPADTTAPTQPQPQPADGATDGAAT